MADPIWRRGWGGALLRDPTKRRKELAQTRAVQLARRWHNAMKGVFGQAQRQSSYVTVPGIEIKCMSVHGDVVLDVDEWVHAAPSGIARIGLRMHRFHPDKVRTYRLEDVEVITSGWVLMGLLTAYQEYIDRHPEVLEGGMNPDAFAKDDARRQRRQRTRDAFHAQWEGARQFPGSSEGPGTWASG